MDKPAQREKLRKITIGRTVYWFKPTVFGIVERIVRSLAYIVDKR